MQLQALKRVEGTTENKREQLYLRNTTSSSYKRCDDKGKWKQQKQPIFHFEFALIDST